MTPFAIGLLPLLALAVVVAFDVLCLRDLVRADRTRYLPKWGWAIAVCLSSPWGGLAYLAFGRKR